MKFKKFLAVVLTAAMAASMLTGCGSKDQGTSGNSGNSGNAGNTGSDGVVNINVTRACFNVGTPDAAQVQKVEDAINEYIKDKINVHITLSDIGSGEYTEKANLSLNNNELNLLWTASWESVIGTNDLVPKNAVYDLTDILKGSTLYNSMDASQWEATKYDGKNYFVPVYKDNVEGYDLMVRKDLADKFNWDLSKIKKLSDIEPMLADAKAEGLKYPFLTQKTAMFYRFYIDKFDFFTADVTSNWVAVSRDKNEVVNTIATPEYKEFCTLMAKWAEAGYLSEDEASKVTNDQTAQSKDWAISWWTDIPNNAEANNRYGQEVVMAPITSRWAHSTSALGSCYCVTANSTPEQAKAAVDFLGLLYTDKKLADLYTYGIEGEDYEIDANGQVYKYNPDADGKGGKYNHSMWESVSATIITPETGSPENFAELYKAFNGGATASCAAGFRFDKSKVEAQYTACQNVFEEYGFQLENGAFPVAEVESKLAAYQAALDEAGYQAVLAEFKAQYDAWKK